VKDEEWSGGRAAVDYYFLQQDGKKFKATMSVEPYFYILTKVTNSSFSFTAHL